MIDSQLSVVKLGDFGRATTQPIKNYIGGSGAAIPWCAPEVLIGFPPTNFSDVYSCKHIISSQIQTKYTFQ